LVTEGYTRLHLILDFGFWDREVSKAPINTRDWVLQERVRSTRALYFGQCQVCRECRKQDAAEIFPQDISLPMSAGVRCFEDLTFSRHLAASGERSTDTMYLSWVSTVQADTACHLSVPSDKMVALSVIAKIMGHISSGKYVVGMWHEHLHHELL
jgi:hypothetical protein